MNPYYICMSLHLSSSDQFNVIKPSLLAVEVLFTITNIYITNKSSRLIFIEQILDLVY